MYSPASLPAAGPTLALMTGSTTCVTIDPLFDYGGAAMNTLARWAERYRTYGSHEQSSTRIGTGLGQRHDTVVNFLRTGGRLGRTDLDPAALVARTSYFREEYAEPGRVLAPGAEVFLHHDALFALATCPTAPSSSPRSPTPT